MKIIMNLSELIFDDGFFTGSGNGRLVWRLIRNGCSGGMRGLIVLVTRFIRRPSRARACYYYLSDVSFYFIAFIIYRLFINKHPILLQLNIIYKHPIILQPNIIKMN